MESHLQKIKFLLALASSPNEHEAATAKALAEKLISKYNVTPEQLDALKENNSQTPIENLLYHIVELSEWKATLAFLVAKKYNCFILQEQIVTKTGHSEYDYSVLGHPEDVESTKFIFNDFVSRIEELVSKLPATIDYDYLDYDNVDQDYIDSYCEGVVEGLRSTLEGGNFKIPKKQANPKQESTPGIVPTNTISQKPISKPTNEVSKVNTKTKIKNIFAYFAGVKDAKLICFDNLLKE